MGERRSIVLLAIVLVAVIGTDYIAAEVHTENADDWTSLMLAEHSHPNGDVNSLLREAAAPPSEDFQPRQSLYDESAVGESELAREVLEERFFPIGWSRSGALAYVSRTFSFNQCGDCMSVDIVILDTVSNVKLWDRNLHHGEIYESITSNGEWTRVERTLPDIWTSEAGTVVPVLERYGVIPDSNPEFLPGTGLAFPDIHEDTEYRIELDGVIETRDVAPPYIFFGAEPTSYEVFLAAMVSLSSRDGWQTVFEAEWKDRHVLTVEIVGSLPSSQSNNAVIVLALEYLGFEHDRLLDLEVIGVSPPGRTPDGHDGKMKSADG